jgi:hypothetical protein
VNIRGWKGSVLDLFCYTVLHSRKVIHENHEIPAALSVLRQGFKLDLRSKVIFVTA